MTIEPWSGGRAPSHLLAEQRPPRSFSLDTVMLSGPFPNRYAVRPAALDPRALTSRMPTPASWTMLGSDSATVLWSNGYVGVELRVQVRGEELTGVALAFHDGHFTGEPPHPVDAVAARRVACPTADSRRGASDPASRW